MPSSPAATTAPSSVLHVLDKALDQSHDVKAEVEACAADLGLVNDYAQARIAHGATTLPAAQALANGLAIEHRVQGCADDLQQVTDDLARGLDQVKVVEQALQRSRAALTRSETALSMSQTALAESRAAERMASQPVLHALTPPHDAVDPPRAVIEVLVAEDDDFMRDLVHRVLAGAGMQVASYACAVDLLGAGKLATATILLLDVRMPGMSGLELQDLLRQRGVDLPVVFMSGAGDLALAVAAMRAGAADFIEKPFEGASLVERLRRAVDRHDHRLATPDGRADPSVLARFETLTPREREVFDLLVTGMSSKLIARALGGSFRTIEVHRAQVMRKMSARHLPELVRMSIESLTSRRVGMR